MEREWRRGPVSLFGKASYRDSRSLPGRRTEERERGEREEEEGGEEEQEIQPISCFPAFSVHLSEVGNVKVSDGGPGPGRGPGPWGWGREGIKKESRRDRVRVWVRNKGREARREMSSLCKSRGWAGRPRGSFRKSSVMQECPV